MSDKILIVDDDADSLKLIGLMLQRQGYQVITVSSGAEALESAMKEWPALILLDVMMPVMDGYEVARRLRADPQTADIPILMFTAKSGVDDKVAGFEAGADDYLTKPTHPAELASRIKVLLGRTTKPLAGPMGEPGQIISFLGVKGGVGTTTLALNTAVAFADQMGDSTIALAEMRPGQGSLGLMLGFEHPAGLGNLLAKGTGELTVNSIEGDLVRHRSGISLLMSSPVPDPSEDSFSPETGSALVRRLSGVVDYLVLDLGSGLSPATERIVALSKYVILCLEPHRVAVALAQRMIPVLNDLGLGPLRINPVLVNRTPSSLQMSWQSVQQALQKDLLAIISPAPELAYQALENQTSMIQLQPGSITSGQFRKLGEDLTALLGPQAERPSGVGE